MSWIPSYKKPGSGSYTPPTWTDGTDEEIAEALEKHYAGDIDLTEFWTVGDERPIHLSAMSATASGGYNIGESHAEQDAVLVILHKDAYTLVTPINGHTKNTFVVGLKNPLNEGGRINPKTSGTGTAMWINTVRYIWTYSVFPNSIGINSIFKPFYYTAYSWNSSTGYQYNTTIQRPFTLPTLKELYGDSSYSKYNAENNKLEEYNDLVQFDYYKTNANIPKYNNGNDGWLWTRSVVTANKNTPTYFAVYSGGTNAQDMECSYPLGLIPFGVI